MGASRVFVLAFRGSGRSTHATNDLNRDGSYGYGYGVLV